MRMVIRIDQKSEEPLYLQIRSQIIAAIATGELVPGTALPSVRALASDLGINLHTVNKAYAVLRDEGYVLMRGRSGAYIADPCEDDRADRAQIELAKMEDGLFEFLPLITHQLNLNKISVPLDLLDHALQVKFVSMQSRNDMLLNLVVSLKPHLL